MDDFAILKNNKSIDQIARPEHKTTRTPWPPIFRWHGRQHVQIVDCSSIIIRASDPRFVLHFIARLWRLKCPGKHRPISWTNFMKINVARKPLTPCVLSRRFRNELITGPRDCSWTRTTQYTNIKYKNNGRQKQGAIFSRSVAYTNFKYNNNGRQIRRRLQGGGGYRPNILIFVYGVVLLGYGD